MGAVIQLRETLTGKRFVERDFSGQDLSREDLSRSIFERCNFDGSNLSQADCTGSDFIGSTFRKSILYRTNFRDAKLAATVFEPDDCYGMTLTMSCKTFENACVSQLWFYSWLILGSMMLPKREPVPVDIRAMVIGIIGAERYVKLRQLFQRRDI
jgi:uncharacterized protein YjbI with pentapeptide repeats